MSEQPFRWSQAAEQWLHEYHDALDCDVLVVGTGYGGSFAASTLADPSRRVWVVERGREYPLGSFPDDIGALPGHVRLQQGADSDGTGNPDALLDFRRHEDVSVLVANGLGGGSLINAGVAVLPDPELLTHPSWPAHYRDNAANREALHGAMLHAQAVLQARPFEGASGLGKFQALTTLGRSMGVPVEVAPITVASQAQISTAGVQQAACTRCGNCFTGCNVGAKNTTLTHVLPDAVRAGAQLITGLTVLRVEPLEGPHDSPYRWAVHMTLTDSLSLPSRRDNIVVRARTVVLAAGALGSTEILLRSRSLQLSPWLGKRFSTNGDALALGWGMGSQVNGMARTDEAERAPANRVGPTITGMLAPVIHVNDQARRVLVEEGAVPSALTQAVLALGATLSLPHRYTRSGQLGVHALWQSQGQAVDMLATPPAMDRHALLLLLMGQDDADGRIRLYRAGEPGPTNPDALTDAPVLRRDAMDIRWEGATAGPRSAYYQALHEWLRQAAEQGGFQGGDYLPSPLWKALPDDFGAVAAGVGKPQGLTVHPLGGCAMGDGPDTGVVDWQGTVFRAGGGTYDGLHVLDGAMLPTAVGVNPFVTISGLSLVAARAIRQGLAAQPVATVASAIGRTPTLPASPVAQAVVPRRREAVASQAGVQLQFREHLQGQWVGARPPGMPDAPPEWTDDERQREWVVAVDVDVDVSQWLTNPTMRLEGARMRVFHNPAPHAISIRPELTQTTPWLEGRGWVSLLANDAPGSVWVDGWRRAKAVGTFWWRRSWRDMAGAGGQQPWLKRVQGVWRAAGNHAQYRTLDYSFALSAPTGGTPPLLARGQKKLAYAPGQKNLWNALIQIDLAMETASGQPQGTLAVTVDLIDMVRRQRLQVASAADTPAAIIGLAGFSALWLRAMFQTHFWSLRGLDYEKLSPGGPALHGPLWPQGAAGPACEPQVFKFLVPRTQAALPADGQLQLELTRYQPQAGSGPAKHLLMIHGLAHGATVFSTHTTDGRNMAAAFLAQGYTVWLLDHRLSNRLGYASQPHCMDDVARLDIPAAVKWVHRTTGQPVHVFAHCVGGAAFAMATLSGLLNDAQGRSLVQAAIIHAVHPWVVPSASNQLSGELASLYRDWLPANLAIDPVPPSEPGALDQLLDRLAASLPWPDSELAAHEADIRDPAGGTAVCNRMTLFYGREWVHANLAEATHRELASLVGPASVAVFRQLYYVITRQRLTDREGAGVYMKHEQFDAHWQFPVLFSHGTENRVFDPRSAVRSWHQLSRLQANHPDAAHRQVRLFMPPGYGHMDFLFGKNAHRDVYPSLVAFMRDPGGFSSSFGVDGSDLAQGHQRVPHQWQDHAAQWPQMPLSGPLLQLQPAHTALDSGDRPVDRARALVVWVELPNDPWLPCHPPCLARADDASGTPLPGVEVVGLTSVHGGDGAVHPVRDRPANRVTLLEGPGRYWVLRLYDSAAQPLSDLPALQLVWGNPAPGSPPDLAGGHGAVPLDLTQLPWWQTWAAAGAAGGQGQSVSWLATSCRWPGLPFERNAVDGLATHMQAQVHHPHHPAQALVLLGDQIYADATANLFQVQEGDERLAQFYRDAWGSPQARALLAQLPTYTVVDDHEYGDNWDGSANPMGDAVFMNGFEAALAYQWRWTDGGVHEPRVVDLSPTHTAPGEWAPRSAVRGFWRPFHIGSLPAFAMDTRSERQPRTIENWQQAPLVSEAQMQAVEHWLLAHRDQPKVLCSGSVFGWAEQRQLRAPELGAASDSWAGFPTSWRRLVRFMVKNGVQHTVFLSGDYHFSGAATLTLTSEDLPPVHAVSVVCSGWNASLPFANAVATDFACHADAVLPGSDHTAGVVSHAEGMGTALRQFSRLTVRPQGQGGWQVAVDVLDEAGSTAAQWVAQL